MMILIRNQHNAPYHAMLLSLLFPWYDGGADVHPSCSATHSHAQPDTKGSHMNQDAQAPDTPIMNIIGEKITLGPVRHELLPLYLRWYNDFEVNRTRIFTWRPFTHEAAQALYHRISQEEGIAS